MKFSRSAPAVLIGAVLVAMTVVSVVSVFISRDMTSQSEEAQFSLMGRAMEAALRSAEDRATAGAEVLAALPNVKKAFAVRNRDELLSITQAGFAVQREKYGVSQAQFHLAPAVSFLRVHNPPKFGEDLSAYRALVVEVNQNKAVRKGVEVTTSGVGIFGTVPMLDEAGKHTGSVEMAFEFGPLLDEMKKAHGFELALFMDEKILRGTATSLGGDVFNDQNRVGKFLKFHATHPELLRSLVGDGDIAIAEESHYVRTAGGVPYGVLLQPVYDYAKKQIGVVAVVRDFGATRSAGGRAIVWQALLGVITAVLLIGIILMVVRGVLLRPLGLVDEQLAALARGEPGADIPHQDDFCEEVRSLAESYQALRSNAAKARDDGSRT